MGEPLPPQKSRVCWFPAFGSSTDGNGLARRAWRKSPEYLLNTYNTHGKCDDLWWVWCTLGHTNTTQFQMLQDAVSAIKWITKNYSSLRHKRKSQKRLWHCNMVFNSKFTKNCTKIPLIPSNRAPACLFVVNGSTSCNQFCRLFSPTNLHLQQVCKVRPKHDKSCTSSPIIVIWVPSPSVKDNSFIYSTPSVPQPPGLFYKILCLLWNVKEIYRISSETLELFPWGPSQPPECPPPQYPLLKKVPKSHGWNGTTNWIGKADITFINILGNDRNSMCSFFPLHHGKWAWCFLHDLTDNRDADTAWSLWWKKVLEGHLWVRAVQ